VQPAPVQVHVLPEQLLNEHFAPASHCSVQLPLEQSTSHVEPAAHAVRQPPEEQSMLQSPPFGHDVLQPPLEQSTVHSPAPQYVVHLPLEQSCVQAPVEGQVREQLPFEHDWVHGDVVHCPAQPPFGQEQVAPLQVAAARVVPAAVSGICGPPLGEPASPPDDEMSVPPLDPPHAQRHTTATKTPLKRRSLIDSPPQDSRRSSRSPGRKIHRRDDLLPWRREAQPLRCLFVTRCCLLR
jgi:hypothetical protein